MLDSTTVMSIILLLVVLAFSLPTVTREGTKKGRDMVKRRSIRIDTEWMDLDSGNTDRKVVEHHRASGTPIGGARADESVTERVERMMGGRR